MKKALLTSIAAIALVAGIVYAAGGPQPAVGLYWYDNTDPTMAPGMAAPADQLLIRTDHPSLYYKSGPASTAWTPIGQGTSSGGTVTSVACGTGVSCVPSPITTTGTISLNITPTICPAGQAEITTAADGTSTCASYGTSTFVNGTPNNELMRSDGTNSTASGVNDTGAAITIPTEPVTIDSETQINGVANATSLIVTNVAGLQTGSIFNAYVRSDGTFDTTSGGIDNFNGYFEAHATRAAGANPLFNFAGFFDATGGDANTAIYAANGDVLLNQFSGTTQVAGAFSALSTSNLVGKVDVHDTIVVHNSVGGGAVIPTIDSKDGNPNGIVTAALGSFIMDGTDGLLFVNTDGATTWAQVATGTLPVSNVWFGTGDDGSSAPCGTIAINTALTRDIHCTTLTVNTGITLNTTQFKVYVTGTLTLGAGAIVGSIGNGAAGSTGGAGIQTHFYVAEAGGGNGSVAASTSAGGGGAGGGVAPCEWPDASTTAHGAPGASAGQGGGGGNGTGASGGGGGAIASCGGGSENLGRMTQSYLEYGFLKSSGLPIQGPSGGGGGAAGGLVTTCAGGGGGGSGGFTYVAAKILAGSGTISSRGGDGSAAVAGTGNCGGGGGGGGGLLAVIYGVNTGTVTTTVAGGNGGAAVGTGEGGGAGHAGQAWVWSVGSN